MNKGRPRKPKPIEKLNISSFKEDIQIYRNALTDSLEEEIDNLSRTRIQKILNLEQWKFNLLVTYSIFKDKKRHIKELAEILGVDPNELLAAIRKIKKELL